MQGAAMVMRESRNLYDGDVAPAGDLFRCSPGRWRSGNGQGWPRRLITVT